MAYQEHYAGGRDGTRLALVNQLHQKLPQFLSKVILSVVLQCFYKNLKYKSVMYQIGTGFSFAEVDVTGLKLFLRNDLYQQNKQFASARPTIY